MLEYKGYVGTVELDEGAFTGRVVGLRDVITFEGETYLDVEQAFRDSIDDYIAFCAERPSLAEGRQQPYRTYKIRITLRLTPEVHHLHAARAKPDGGVSGADQLSLCWLPRSI